MIKINVSENNESQFLAQTQIPQECTCYACSGCAWCVVFAPVVGVALAPALGAGLVGVRDNL